VTSHYIPYYGKRHPKTERRGLPGARLVLADLGPTMPQAAQDVIGVSPDLERVAAEVQEAGAAALALATDVSRTAAVDALV
jgi:hypothetical protein